MADNTKAVDKFIKAKVLAEYRPIVAAFRELVRQNFPELTEEMRAGTEAYYGVPSYRLNRIIAVISPTKKGHHLRFFQRRELPGQVWLLAGRG